MSEPVGPEAPLSLDDILESDVDGLLDMPEMVAKVTSSDRLERAFLEVVEFRRTHDRLPSSTTREIAERKLGARLDGILANDQKIEALRHLDEFGLLETPEPPASLDELLDGDALDDLLGDESGVLDVSDLPVLRRSESPESVAKREKAEDFVRFEHLFKARHAELVQGSVLLASFKGVHTIYEGQFFVLNGVMLLVAEVGETKTMVVGGKSEQKQRLRVVFENGTESSMYRQSLSIRLHEQDGQAVVPASISLEDISDADTETGHIYVLRSLSTDPQIAGLADLHKIGFSRSSVEERIKNAEKSPTYLMAPVQVVADYRLYNARPSALEHLLHRVFAAVRLDLTQIDRQGRPYDPSEWFMVPRDVIDQAIEMIMTGEIAEYVYEPTARRLILRT